MKITDSTSVSLKLILSLLPFVIGFGAWMYRIDSSVTTFEKNSVKWSKKLNNVERLTQKIADFLDFKIAKRTIEDDEIEGEDDVTDFANF